MSLKDTRYYRNCPICGDTLIGTDDALEVFESLKSQLEENIAEPNCTLCGEPCPEAAKIVAAGEPELHDNPSQDD